MHSTTQSSHNNLLSQNRNSFSIKAKIWMMCTIVSNILKKCVYDELLLLNIS